MHGYWIAKGAQSLRSLIEPYPSTRHLRPVSVSNNAKESDMASGEQRGNREAKKPKKPKVKTIAAAPSQKTGGWQPNLASGKKK
jgi:hypothetical protein